MKFTDRCPATWKELQDDVALLLNQSGYRAVSPCTIDTVRGKVEVDVLVESPDELVKRIVCECKFWNSSVPKEKVHAFRTVVQDSGASLGLLISQAGFQSGAIEAANLSNVRLMTWNEFTDIIADKWTLTRLKQLKMESVPLSEYTSSFHFPFDDLKDEDVGRYLKACDKYRSLRTTCWEITRKDLKENDSLTDFWYKGSEFTTIESYLNFLSDQVMAGLKEFGEILANSNITIPPERLEKSYGYICNGVQREHNKKLNNGLPILHKVPPK